MPSNLLKFNSNLVMPLQDLDAALVKNRGQRPHAQTTSLYLRLDRNDGSWIYGPDSILVENGSNWAIDPRSLKSGWVWWSDPTVTGKKSEKLGEVMGPFNSPASKPDANHAEHGGQWRQQIGFELLGISGDEIGQGVSYSASSGGGVKAYNTLYDSILNRPAVDQYIPIVTLEQSHYPNKTFGGITYEPIFKIVAWADDDEQLTYLNGGGDGVVSSGAIKPSEVEAEAVVSPQPAKPQRRRRSKTNYTAA